MLRLRSLCAASRLARGWQPWPPSSGAIFRRHDPRYRLNEPAHEFHAEEPLTELGDAWYAVRENKKKTEKGGEVKEKKKAKKIEAKESIRLSDLHGEPATKPREPQTSGTRKKGERTQPRQRAEKPEHVQSKKIDETLASKKIQKASPTTSVQGKLVRRCVESNVRLNGRQGAMARHEAALEDLDPAQRFKLVPIAELDSRHSAMARYEEALRDPAPQIKVHQIDAQLSSRESAIAKHETSLLRGPTRRSKLVRRIGLNSGDAAQPELEANQSTLPIRKIASKFTLQQQLLEPQVKSIPNDEEAFQQAEQPADASTPNNEEAFQQAEQPADASTAKNDEAFQQAEQPAAASTPNEEETLQTPEQPATENTLPIGPIQSDSTLLDREVPAAESKPQKEQQIQQTLEPVTRSKTRKATTNVPDFSTREAVRHLLGLTSGSLPALETPSSPPLFICVDLEAHEFRQKVILELGVATLDLNDLRSYPNCDPWSLLTKVAYKHYIVQEHKHVKNRKFAVSCPNRFLFGDSEMEPGKEIAKKYKRFPETDTTRPVVLVGHSLSSDIKYLDSLGVKTRAWPNLIGTIDTQKLAAKVEYPLNLGKLLAEFGLPVKFPHNAGNDAAFTMHALLLFALFKDEWKEADAMDKAKSFIGKLQRVKKSWGPLKAVEPVLKRRQRPGK